MDIGGYAHVDRLTGDGLFGDGYRAGGGLFAGSCPDGGGSFALGCHDAGIAYGSDVCVVGSPGHGLIRGVIRKNGGRQSGCLTYFQAYAGLVQAYAVYRDRIRLDGIIPAGLLSEKVYLRIARIVGGSKAIAVVNHVGVITA